MSEYLCYTHSSTSIARDRRNRRSTPRLFGLRVSLSLSHADFSGAADMRAVSSHYQSAVGILFPFSLYVAWRPTIPIFVSHILVGSLCGFTALAMGSKHDAIWVLAVKVMVFLFVTYTSFYLSGCYLTRTSPRFPPELSLQQWLELAEGK